MIVFACPSRPAAFVCLCHRAASFTYFGELLRCPHECIITNTKVYIARNNIHVELIRFRKNSDFIDIGNFEVGPIVSRLPCFRPGAIPTPESESKDDSDSDSGVGIICS